LHIGDAGDDGGEEIYDTAITDGEIDVTAGDILDENPPITDETQQALGASVPAAMDTLPTVAGKTHVIYYDHPLEFLGYKTCAVFQVKPEEEFMLCLEYNDLLEKHYCIKVLKC
jgi:hypothetical protein